MRLIPSATDPAMPPRLSREDRLGIGVAIFAHLAILAALLLTDREPLPIEAPERIAITVSDNIALESVSPNPMADPAPSVAAQIGETQVSSEAVEAPSVAPVSEPRPALVPTRSREAAPVPERRSEARPAPRTERRRPDTPSRASRIGDDFLAGSGGSGSDTDQPAQRAGPLTAASLSAAIARQLKPHWTAPSGVDAEQLVSVLAWEMNRDGSLKAPPRLVSQSGVTSGNAPQKDRHAELAVRAVQLAAPFDLPDEYYDAWKRVDAFRFDRRLSR